MFPVLYKFELVTLFVITLNRASKLKDYIQGIKPNLKLGFHIIWVSGRLYKTFFVGNPVYVCEGM